MKKHLIQRRGRLDNHHIPLEKVGTYEYLKLRLQFWKWRLKRTGGRPVLILWRPGDPQ